jgi:hypothetical protein
MLLTAELGQQRPRAVQQNGPLDYVGGSHKQRWRHGQAERLRGFKVDGSILVG